MQPETAIYLTHLQAHKAFQHTRSARRDAAAYELQHPQRWGQLRQCTNVQTGLDLIKGRVRPIGSETPQLQLTQAAAWLSG